MLLGEFPYDEFPRRLALFADRQFVLRPRIRNFKQMLMERRLHYSRTSGGEML